MKIGILILAHNHLEQLKLLVDILKTDFYLFIHIDAKSDLPEDCFSSEPNVWVIKKYKVYWGSNNQILSSLELFKMAYAQHCDYYMFISGQDFPAMLNHEIISEIEKNPQTNYLDYGRLPRKRWLLQGGFDRMQLYWENLNDPKNVTKLNHFCGLCREIQKRLHLRRKLLPGITYYGGVNWANLSKETLTYILNYLEEHPEYLKSFRHTRTADEIWLQTIVINSPFREKTINDPRRYADWYKGPEFPRTLRIDNYDDIIHSDAFFARKFDTNVDADILEKMILYLKEKADLQEVKT
jgi:hypothetical protein